MVDTVLPNDQAIAFVTKLASDDGFRARYEKDPAAALKEIVPANIVVAGNLKLVKLADKSVFAEVLRQLNAGTAAVCLCQKPPTISLNIGN